MGSLEILVEKSDSNAHKAIPVRVASLLRLTRRHQLLQAQQYLEEEGKKRMSDGGIDIWISTSCMTQMHMRLTFPAWTWLSLSFAAQQAL